MQMMMKTMMMMMKTMMMIKNQAKKNIKMKTMIKNHLRKIEININN